MNYRIKVINGLYYPQYKGLLFWKFFYFREYNENGMYYAKKVCKTERWAQIFIDKQ